jgi:hypothetical protein
VSKFGAKKQRFLLILGELWDFEDGVFMEFRGIESLMLLQ